MLYNFPYFGDINISDLEEYYSLDITLLEKPVSIDMNFIEQAIDQTLANTTHTFLENLALYREQTNKYIYQDFFERAGETHPYITDMLEELEDADLLNMEDDPAKKAQYERNGFDDRSVYLLQKLQLKRIGLYPDSDDYFAIFDYTFDLDGSPCNQVLVVITDHRGVPQQVDWES
ncbi:DUF2004 domain-containing protein [Chitinophaga agri]|uniref:DUF2004 domain-containing protein n=1 Tax=Chitinophaga agri TaxID=2703787 RepID=A0A6B9ZC90_9BACT|nr:DUF2004 domain-containing protein [Chitinophaga agri]QHS59938.1 DUF2004 domain-containing protein [Chitinophaga agri]